MTSCSSVIRPFSLFFSAFFSSTSSPPSSREFYILNNIRINPITSSLCNYLSNSEILRYYPPLSKDIANEGGGGRNMQISSSLIELLLSSSRSFRLRSSKVGAAPVCSRPGTTSTACLILFSRPRRARLLSQFNANEPVSSNYSN